MYLTQAHLAEARRLLDQGSIVGMYDYLAVSCGDRYAILAKGVITGETISGIAAVDFMKNTALSSAGRSAVKVSVWPL